MDEAKPKEVLDTPQVHLFKHENVFGNSFKEEMTKQTPDLLRLNSVANTIESPLPIMNTLTSSNSNISSSFSNSLNSSAPKKNILLRTISQNDHELQRQDSVKMIDSVNSSYYSSQNSSQSSILMPDINEQNINGYTNKTNTINVNNHNNVTNNISNENSFRLINDLKSGANSPINQVIEPNSKVQETNSIINNSLKRKNIDTNNNGSKISDEFSLNLSEKFVKSNNANSKAVYQHNTNDLNDTKIFLNNDGIPEIQNTTNSNKKINAMSFEFARVTSNNHSNNKISTLIQNELYNDNSMKINNYKADSLANKSRSSSSSNDDIVTSSDQNLGTKLKPKRSIMMNNDVRKQQIRNSNREAARRCRERRRNYIETLEANIRNLESKQKTLINENQSLKNEVNALKKTINDQKTDNSDASKQLQNHSQNSNNRTNQSNSINSELGSIGGVPLVVTLNLPNFDVVNSNNQITLTNNDNNNTNNQQVLMKLLNTLMTNNKNQSNNSTTNERDINNNISNNSIENQS